MGSGGAARDADRGSAGSAGAAGLMRGYAALLLAIAAPAAAQDAPPLLTPAESRSDRQRGFGLGRQADGAGALARSPDARLGRLCAPPPSDPRPAHDLRPRGHRDPVAARRRHDLLRHPALAARLERRFAELWEEGSKAGAGSTRAYRLLGRPADQPRPGQRQRPRRGRAGRRRRRHRGERTIGARTCAASSSSSPPSRARRRSSRSAVHGAAGLVSWAQNQKTGWWGDDQSLIRWGHLDTWPRIPTFAFMVSPARAHAWQARLAKGEAIRLHAMVEAGRTPGPI